MLSRFFIDRGWSRDDLKWPVAQVLSAAALVTSGFIDVSYWAGYLGIPLSTTGAHWIQAIAVIVLWIAGKYDRSSLPSAANAVKALLLACALGLSLSGCALHAPASVVTPAGQAAYTADQIVTRLGEFQQAVIDASDANKIKVDDARTIVTWTRAALDTLKQTPGGRNALVASGWAKVRPIIAGNPQLAPWADVLDAFMGGL